MLVATDTKAPFSPAYHPARERATLPYSANTTSQLDKIFNSSYVDVAYLQVSLAKLISGMLGPLVFVQIGNGGPTSIAARVMTEFIVPSCTANEASWIFRLSRLTESAIRMSDFWNPLRPSSSSSRHAV